MQVMNRATRTRPQRGKASATPPSTLRMFPVLFPDRRGEAKKRIAAAMSAGSTLTFSVVRSR